MQRSDGFTLVEMIVAMAIFALLGLVSGQIVSRVVDNYAVLSERGDRLTMVHRAMGVLQRDFLQATPRGIRDTLGGTRGALLLDSDGSIELTRMGWQNPLGRPRSEQQRVAYRFEDETLYRYYWLPLDQAPDTEPLRQEVLTEVSDVEFLILDGALNQNTFWPRDPTPVISPAPLVPTDGAPTLDPTKQAVAVILRIYIAPYGQVERIWTLPTW